MSSYGGTVIQPVRTDSGRTVFSDNAYYYALYSLKPGDEESIDFLGEYTIFVKPRDSHPTPIDVVIKDGSRRVEALECLDVRGYPSRIRNHGSQEAHVLVAGTKAATQDPQIALVRAEDIKKVFKPWGYELWIGKNKSYSLKEVFLKAGRKTSLQYHRQKQETNVLFEGRCNIWFKANEVVGNDEVTPGDLGSVELGAISSVDIVPNTIHRLEALSDIRLYEASTPHLEDVVRVQDDNNRKSGTIETEHQLQICILTAGKGDRMGGLCDVLNKALLPVKGKAVISRIVEKYPKNSRFVVALGYKGDQVRNYLEAAYPGYEFEFVMVDNYDRPGAGPGYSLRTCRTALREKPFYFVACDTLVEDEIPFDLHQDWMGVCGVNFAISDRYCNFTIEGQTIVDMIDKEPYKDNHSKSFIGLAYIHDVDSFWRGQEDRYLHKGEWQMTNGIRHLVTQHPVKAFDFRWTDVGSYQQYLELSSKADGFDFGKTDEFIYMTNGRVIKFFRDAKIAENRVQRTGFNKSVFPRIDFARDQFYAYAFVPGETLYTNNDLGVFGRLLDWLEGSVWQRKSEVDLTAACLRFYRDKTEQRMGAFFEKYPRLRDNRRLINGRAFLPTEELLKKVDWDALAKKHVPAFIHGDLQFDNILTSPDGFTLIDWRQDFAGSLEAGDLYYDLAKLYGGLVLNYDLIKKNLFSYSEDDSAVRFDFNSRNSMHDYREMLERFIVAKGFDLAKVKTLVGLIYLNMAPLHNYPFDKMLFALGTKTLHDALAS